MQNALKILAVDDEPSITASMHFIFGAPAYEVTDAYDGNDALAQIEANGNGYDVVITDEKMPRLTGVELVRELRKRQFGGKIIVLSAHLSSEVREAYHDMNVHVMIDKPFNIHELRRALHAA
jgi:DNA-binding response OmpR family regulator